jgi:predicted dehydrogenase
LQKVRIGIVGAGRMGRIRSLSARAHPQSEVVGVVDNIVEHARALAAEFSCPVDTDWQKLVAREDVDAIVVATPHKYLAPITAAALKAGKYVFCEKPGARSAAEAEVVLRAAYGGSHPTDSGLRLSRQNNTQLTVGFTLRHYPAIVHARELVAKGAIGDLMYVRARYGHGGRPDYNLEWRGDLEMAGGGELLDQGVHLIDLSRWFLGEFEQVSGSVGTYFWGLSHDHSTRNLEDNAFLSLRTETGRIAWLHASWTQWKNLFSFEIYGRQGSIEVNGLAGHYGPQKLQITRRREQGGPPELQELDFGSEKKGSTQDEVWTHEWAAFISNAVDNKEASNRKQDSLSASGLDAWEALKIVEAAYEASRSGKAVIVRQLKAGGPSVSSLANEAVASD